MATWTLEPAQGILTMHGVDTPSLVSSLRSAVLFCCLALACVASGLAFVRTTEIRRIMDEKLTLQGEMETLIQGLRERTHRRWHEPFMVGSLSGDDATFPVEWDEPPDGLFVVVSTECPWCIPLLDDLQTYAPADGVTLYLLTYEPENVRSAIELGNPDGTPAYSIIRPEGGWWEAGLPADVTPLWFRFSNGQLSGLGLGAPETTVIGTPEPQIISGTITGPNTQGGISDSAASRIARK